MQFIEIATFLIFVVPGFLSIGIYRQYYPGKKISDTQMLIWSIISSVIIIILIETIGRIFNINWPY